MNNVPTQNWRPVQRGDGKFLLILYIGCEGRHRSMSASIQTPAERVLAASISGTPRPCPQPQTTGRNKDLPVEVAQAKYNAAKAKAEEDVDIRYAIAAAGVARAEYDRNKKAGEEHPGAVRKERLLLELSLKCTEMDLSGRTGPGSTSGLPEKTPGSPRPNPIWPCFAAAPFPQSWAAARPRWNWRSPRPRYNAAMAKAGDDIDLRYAMANAATRKAEYEIAAGLAQKYPAHALLRSDSTKCCSDARRPTGLSRRSKRPQRAAVEAARVAKAELDAAHAKSADVQQ